MTTTVTFPKIETVKPMENKMLLIEFVNGDKRQYDCRPLLEQTPFALLLDEAFFCTAHPDPHGYGVVWNDAVDLAESEVWLNGKPV